MNKRMIIESVRIAALHDGMDEMILVGHNGIVEIRNIMNEPDGASWYTLYQGLDKDGDVLREFENCSVEVRYAVAKEAVVNLCDSGGNCSDAFGDESRCSFHEYLETVTSQQDCTYRTGKKCTNQDAITQQCTPAEQKGGGA